MAIQYWLKEIFSRPLKVPAGFTVEFENVGKNTGVLATEDGYLNTELAKAAARGVGGIVSIDEATYLDLKKKLQTATLSQVGLLNVLQSQPPPNLQPERNAGSAVEVEVGQPLEVPKSIPMTRKVKNMGKKLSSKPVDSGLFA